MKECNKINTCGEFNTIYSTCVVYEGDIPEHSKYYGECFINAEEAIEELYEFSKNTPVINEYHNGVGLNLTDYTFSVNFGLTDNTVMRGSWRPDWTEIKNKPEPLNLTEGDNITIRGTYPNLSISASGVGQENIIEKIILGQTEANIINKTVVVPIASTLNVGLVKEGKNIKIDSDGTISTNDHVEYTSGNDISISNNKISNTSPNATHTGDVTGDTVLTISPLAVSNSKMTQMPDKTIKGNNTGTVASPKDLTVQEVKQMLNITNQTLIYSTFPQTVNLDNKLHTAIFSNNSTANVDIILPNGQFNGQIVFLSFNIVKTSKDSKIQGSFLVWSDGNTDTIISQIENVGYTMNNQSIYWSTEKNAWMIGRLGI